MSNYERSWRSFVRSISHGQSCTAMPICAARDCSAALLDPEGNVIAQAEMIPMMLAALGECFRACAARYPVAEVQPGEAYLLNDPYSGGHHLNDIILFTPIFYQEQLIGFS